MEREFELGVAGSEVRVSACDCELEMAQEQFAQETRNGAGTLTRRAVAVKRTWSLRYSWLPAKRAMVHDGGMGRDELRALYTGIVSAPANVLSFHIPTEDGQEDVTVQFVAGSWREKLIQRGGRGMVYEVGFGLVEV